MPLIISLRTAALLALGMCLPMLPAWAEKADRDKPMQIEADTMRHDEGKKLTQFTGSVVAVKGTLVLRAARMEVQQDEQGKQVAKLWAAPNERVFFHQKREGLQEFTEGEAENITYDNQTDVVTLTQRAEVRLLRGTQVADQLQGQLIVFNNSTEVMTVDGQVKGAQGSSPNQRVRAVLTPRSKADEVPPPPAVKLRSSSKVTPPVPENKKP
jgi:lipopolysaccharide export system protein LptA